MNADSGTSVRRLPTASRWHTSSIIGRVDQASGRVRLARHPADGMSRRGGYRFTGWGRSSTDTAGHYWFSTLEPGPARPGGAPFFAVAVFARGLLDRLFTRIYLPADDAVLAADPLLSTLDATERRALVAVHEADGGLRFDLHLQGPRETPFLTFPGHS